MDSISKEKFYAQIITKMKSVIEEKHLQQKDIAVAIGITPSALCRYINENRCPSLYLLHKFCNYCGIPMDDLLK